MTALARKDEGFVERRHEPRVVVSTPGRFVLDDDIEHRCRTIDASSSGVALRAPTAGRVGQRIVCYLDAFGRLEGRLSRLFEGGFAVAIAASAVKRERLAEQLAWTAGHPAVADHHEIARDERLTPARTRGVLRLPDARRVGVKIIDLSRSGAAVICPIPVAMGAQVWLGERAAHVTRIARTVVGLSFDEPLGPDAPPDALGL